MVKLVKNKKRESSFRNQILFYINEGKQYDSDFVDDSFTTMDKRLKLIKNKIISLERDSVYNINAQKRVAKLDAKIKHKKKREGD